MQALIGRSPYASFSQRANSTVCSRFQRAQASSNCKLPRVLDWRFVIIQQALIAKVVDVLDERRHLTSGGADLYGVAALCLATDFVQRKRSPAAL